MYTTTNGAKGTECGTLPGKFHLKRQGGIYGFKVDYVDKAGTSRSGTMRVQFDYFVNNFQDYTDSEQGAFSDTFTINVK